MKTEAEIKERRLLIEQQQELIWSQLRPVSPHDWEEVERMLRQASYLRANHEVLTWVLGDDNELVSTPQE